MKSFPYLIRDYICRGTGRFADGKDGPPWRNQAFADKCGVDVHTVYNWKNGRSTPHDTMHIEAAIFGPDQSFMIEERKELRASRRSTAHSNIKSFQPTERNVTLKMQITRVHLHSYQALVDIGVFDLYGRLFPEEQQLSEADLCSCLFHLDIGKPVPIKIDGKLMQYCMDSELAVAIFDGKAVGLAFYTYEPKLQLIFFSYIAVDESYRGRSNEFMRQIMKRWQSQEKYKGCKGIIFEVEPINRSAVTSIVEHCGKYKNNIVKNIEDCRVIEAFRRVKLYELSGMAYRFEDNYSREPLLYKSPCIDSDLGVLEWESREVEMWLMFAYLEGAEIELSARASNKLWRESVRLAIEVIGKSQVVLRPGNAGAYLRYMTSLLERIKSVNIQSTPALGRYFDFQENKDLYERQRKLKLEPKLS